MDYGAMSQGAGMGQNAGNVAGDWMFALPAQQMELDRQGSINTGNAALDAQAMQNARARMALRKQALLRASAAMGDANKVNRFQQSTGAATANQSGQNIRRGGQAAALARLKPTATAGSAWGQNATAAQAPHIAALRGALQRRSGQQWQGAAQDQGNDELDFTDATQRRLVGNEDLRENVLGATSDRLVGQGRMRDHGPGAGYYDRMMASSLMGLAGAAAGAGAGGGGFGGIK